MGRSEAELVAQAQSAAVEALNGLADLERYLEHLGRSTAMWDVRFVIQRLRQINYELSEEMDNVG